jgi:hypothetical protein
MVLGQPFRGLRAEPGSDAAEGAGFGLDAFQQDSVAVEDDQG